MPGYQTHLTVSTLGSALLVAWGTARYGWDGAIPTLAFVAGAAGGLVPDLDSDTSKPRRWAGGLVAAAVAVGAAGFLTSSGSFLERPWEAGPTALAALYLFLIVNVLTFKLLSRYTRHRGLFHSLAVPFLYGGLMALLAGPRGTATAMAVWLLSLFGVFSHLVLDALRSLSLHPLKPATRDLAASAWLWTATALVTLAAFLRLTQV
ncbi:MAG: metal-dependent hydrolase [Candidatus Adiutrix sp.]|jgi:membrane-bound metal-dependent hydrolase YbcI (DUF457 family)|nr:metal-dependent hydrolase [Candidatus Adiutrix sp.]